MKLQNPHDTFFKETFGDTEVAKDFLNHYLPNSLMDVVDLHSLEPQKDSFVDKNLDESFSDLLFKAVIQGEEGYFYFLFEHKSYPSKGIALQLLKYMIAIWEAKTQKENNWELPIIIPLVIYHGRDNWQKVKKLGDMMKGYDHLPEEVQVYVPNFAYLLYDFSPHSDEEIKGEAILKIYQMVVREIFNPNNQELVQSIMKALTFLREIKNKEKGIDYLETMMRYVFSTGKNLTEEDAQQVMKQIETTYPEGSEVIVTLAERYMEKGMEKGKMEVAKNLILKGLSTKDIIEVTGLEEKEINKIKKQVLQ